MEQPCGFLADEVDAACVVDVIYVMPGDALCPVLFLRGRDTITLPRLLNTQRFNARHWTGLDREFREFGF